MEYHSIRPGEVWLDTNGKPLCQSATVKGA